MGVDPGLTRCGFIGGAGKALVTGLVTRILARQAKPTPASDDRIEGATTTPSVLLGKAT